MDKYFINEKNFNLELDVTDNSVCISGGNFGEISLCESPVFYATVKNVNTNEKKEISSASYWNTVKVKEEAKAIQLLLYNPEGTNDICFSVTAKKSESNIEWMIEVTNNNPEWSVMTVTYPSPVMTASYFDFFVPLTCGRVVKDAGKRDFFYDSFEEFIVRMHHFAVYGRKNGIYIGIEDPKSAVKRYVMNSGNDKAEIKIDFIGIDASKPANSFSLSGASKWQYFDGDWYDATLIYADFVYKKAEWLPEIDENGRPDTPQKFKDVPFWIFDYIPNSEYQRDNTPRSLANLPYPPEHWYETVIEFQKRLNVPIAYHVYNWHHIPFNVEYPHFMPAREEFKAGVKELRKHNIYILPYINSVSWEADDTEMNHEINFENTGKYGCGIREDGSNCVYEYPQTTVSGKKVQLTQMCPSFEKWHEINYNTVRQMEKELDIDGIYFDQISACIGRPCYSHEHNHTTGGGSYWVDGYNKMMKKINAEKPAGSFYLSECNTEGYMKSFDGFLTWMWVSDGDVPAFPLIYSGYIQLIGRFTSGIKRDDVDFFKYETAKSLLYGQQIGWCNADVMFNSNKFDFLKKIVHIRYEYKELFNSSKMLRPPYIKCNLENVTTTPVLKFKDNIVMEQVLSGAWKQKNGNRIAIFLVNISDKDASFEMSFNAEEYGLSEYELPKEFVVENGICSVKGTINPTECKVWELKHV